MYSTEEKPDVERRLIMDGVASIGSVGAVPSSVSLKFDAQVRAAKLRRTVTEALGVAALRLINAAIVQTVAREHDLDLTA